MKNTFDGPICRSEIAEEQNQWAWRSGNRNISKGNFKRKKMEQNIQELWDNYKKSTTYDNVIPPAEQGVNKWSGNSWDLCKTVHKNQITKKLDNTKQNKNQKTYI